MPQSLNASARGVRARCTLSVAVEHCAGARPDRRLLAVDLWLVDRLPGGKERSQPLSLRGLYNQPIPFYFDTLTAGYEDTRRLRRPANLAGRTDLGIKITTRSRVVDLKPAQRPAGYPAGRRGLRSTSGSKTATLRLVSERGRVSAAPAGRPTGAPMPRRLPRRICRSEFASVRSGKRHVLACGADQRYRLVLLRSKRLQDIYARRASGRHE